VITLYISYDGVLEPLGQSQVLAYQKHLAKDFHLHLVSFEKPQDWMVVKSRKTVAHRIANSGIVWHPLSYHKHPPVIAKFYDLFAGAVLCLWLVLSKGVHIVHARSYVAAVIALILKRLTGVRFIFDMRGFWADERIDGSLWASDGSLYKIAKWLEREFLLNADHVVSLTHAAVREMEKFPYLVGRMPTVTVIPTCADLEQFCPQPEIEKEFLLGYLGSAGTWYEFDATVACFAEALRLKPQARFLIINRNEHEYIRERLIAGGVPLSAVELRVASYSEVPKQIARVFAGIFFYKPSFSRAACAPTKLGEFLGCGVPCLSNSGVGDMTEILEGERIGVAVNDFSSESLRWGLSRLLDLVAEHGIDARCVAVAHKHFSLYKGVDKYRKVYQGLISNS
jgi:glycosyltransferase involved in cell wall biosynthesis